MTPDYLHKRFNYNPDTGEMTWKRIPEATKFDRMWNTRFAGTSVGNRLRCGHLQCRVSGKNLLVHRIAWAMTYGDWPSADIDHANGDGGDNRLSNLRLATRRQNVANSKIRSNNTSGHRGVVRHRDKWQASIGKTERRHLGTFKTPEDAAKAYDLAAAETYGRFARLNFARVA